MTGSHAVLLHARMARKFTRIVLNNPPLYTEIEVGKPWPNPLPMLADAQGKQLAEKQESGEPWPDIEAYVSIIFHREGYREEYIETKEKVVDGERVVEVEKEEVVQAPHYEVWSLAAQGSKMRLCERECCRRVPHGAVLYADEAWPRIEALRAIKRRLKSDEDMEIDDNAPDEPDAAPVT